MLKCLPGGGALQTRNWRKPIGEILIGRGQITSAQLEEAIALQRQQPGKKLGQILVQLGYVSQKTVLHAYAEQLGVFYEVGADTD